ncbi:MAG: AraC family transcriptional regulator [Spirochaetaceae bacterium]
MKVDEQFPGSIRTENKYFRYQLLGCNDNELSINGMGLKETMKPCFNIRPKGNVDYLILFFYDNIDISILNGLEITIRNKWIILSPGTKHSYGNKLNSWCHSWIHLSGDFFESQIKEYNIPINVLQTMDISTVFESLLTQIHEEVYLNSSPIFKIIKNSINSFLLKVSRIKSKHLEPNIPENLLKVKKILDFRYHENLPLSLLAEVAGCSIPYLCLKFKAIFKLSPTDYLVTKRINIAKHFLTTTDMRISEISMKAGFNDIYYFSRIFKKKIGVSPSLFRKKPKN